MALPDELSAIAGAQELHDWFGYWPTFHDAEIISLHLNRVNPSLLKIHAFEMTKEVNEAGYYVLTKHVVVEFLIDISDSLKSEGLDLYRFNHQNAITSSLRINKISKEADSGFLLAWTCFGLSGAIEADSISI